MKDLETPGETELLLATSRWSLPGSWAADGERILLVVPAESRSALSFRLVLDWPEKLTER